VLIGFSKARCVQKSDTQTSPDDFALDVWGVGMTIAEVMAGCKMCEICDLSRVQMHDREKRLFSGSPWVVDLSESMSSTEAADFVKAACTLSPVLRPSVAKLMEQPFLRRTHGHINAQEHQTKIHA
jgi:hypothetical protein